MITPRQFVANAINLFRGGTLILLVTPNKGGFEAQCEAGVTGTSPKDALDMVVEARCMLNRTIAGVLRGVGDMVGKSDEDMLEYFEQLVRDRMEQTSQSHEVTTTAEKQERCGCQLPRPTEAVIKGVTTRVCMGCGLPIVESAPNLREMRKRRTEG